MGLRDILSFLIGGVIFGAPFFIVGFFVRKRFAERLIRTAESKAKEILVTAKRESESIVKGAQNESQKTIAKLQRDFEDKIAETRRDLQNQEKVLSHKENVVDQKIDIIEKKEKEAGFKLQEAAQKEKVVVDREKELERLLAEEKDALKRISSINPEDAKRELLKRMEIEVRTDAGRMIRDIEKQAEEEAEKKAKKILSLAIQRCAVDHTLDQTVTIVHLPADDMKGRIIGKDGRNIRTFETLTGVDLVIDETPGIVTLSSFDGVRREIAKMALEELMKDGRIQPSRVEEVVQKYKRHMENVLKEEGEKALLEIGANNVHPEVVKLLGRLKFRSSYGQNVLAHSLEVAYLMNVIAGEMGLDPVLARRAGLMHDLGKAVSHDVEGPHALIGGELARRYGEHPDVIHAIEAHHEDIPMGSVWPMLVQAADAVSAARPGARRESYDSYIKRLKTMEEIADNISGVEKSYAIQGGHEIRVVVKADRVPDDAMPALAREISKKIENSLQYPGQIKVVVIRETRVTELAK